MDRVEKRMRKKISLWTFLKFVDTFHVTSIYIYIYVRSPLSITAFRFLKRDFRHTIAHTIPFETLNYVTSVLYLILDLTLEKRFHNRTLARMNLPALVADISRPRDIRYSIEICVSAAGNMEEADEKTRSKGQRKRKREGEGEICWLLLASWYGFAHLFQSGFSSVDGRFSTFTKEWFPAKVFKSRPKMRIRVARNFEARPTFLIFGFLIFAAFRLFLSLFLCLRTNATRGVCIFVKIDPC